MKLYGVYDTKNNDLPILIADKPKEIAKYFKTTVDVIYSTITRKNLIGRRYYIEKLEV